MYEPDLHRFLRPAVHLLLSAHHDDLPLSVGGSVAVASRAGEAVVGVVVFGSPPPGTPLTAFARRHHQEWGVGPEGPGPLRDAEDAAAARILGMRPARLPFADAIYRADYYVDNDTLFGPVHVAESGLSDDIAAATRALLDDLAADIGVTASSSRIYAPLGIGNHVDHQVLTRTGLVLAGEGRDVWFYDDIPYSLVPGRRDDRIRQLREDGHVVRPIATIPVSEVWEQRLDAIMAYESQLEKVFVEYAGFRSAARAELDARLRAYHDVSTVGPVETFSVVTG